MSIYRPKLEDLRLEEQHDGWYVFDKYGPVEGPYESIVGLWEVAKRIAGED